MSAVQGRLLEHFLPLREAEEKLLARCTLGQLTRLDKSTPIEATEQNSIRAKFLRFLILGGDHNVKIHESGILLSGAYIEGVLNLKSATITSNLKLRHCRFAEKILLANAQVRGLIDLSHSALRGFSATLLSIDGILCFDKVASSETINLRDSRIGGSLLFRGSQLNGPDGVAFTADRAVIEGSVRLQDDFQAIGEVRFCGASLNSQLIIQNSYFRCMDRLTLNITDSTTRGGVFLSPGFKSEGTVRLTNARIAGTLSLMGASLQGQGGASLSAKNLQVEQELRLTKLEIPLEWVILTDANVKTLNDSPDSWGDRLYLSGFTYSNLLTTRPLTARDRIQWLDKQNPRDAGTDGKKGVASQFKKQPWQQIQKVFEEMGRTEEANQLGMELERRLHKAGLAGRSTLGPHPTLVHHLYGTLLGFGYKPMRLVLFFFLTWFFCATVYWYAALEHAVFAPSDPVVFQHDDYLTCQPEHKAAWAKRFPSRPEPQPEKPEGAGNWYTCETLRGEYTGFSPLGYSLDILLPLIDLQQEKSWGPMTPTPKKDPMEEFDNFTWGHSTRLLVWIETLIGWGISLVLVGMASGLIRKRSNE
ncbi:hypothetical protein [Pseudomonas chlororaphis]|uniref:Membrane-associated oxidoreductase n=1 Tax=Pseudomonas chlororaphis subsp. aurantiaca TaxID=86192 RepID=A0AAJ0ZH05_9PSED|nr:hypothetical protein [Pseudomonas chlororaphis]AZD74145.1 hypothetical protein C4K16_3788 [Pseudomonas chlororaphis subsp. aurantiaca]MBU4632396.1 hypothetical protein [Pseudomonas chlororaphis subsp. aurantiaca]